MTKKQELLSFIDFNVSGSSFLKLILFSEANFSALNSIFPQSKEKLTQRITDNFNDDLEGKIDIDGETFSILSWEIYEEGN